VIDIERSDWSRSPGRFATVVVGPFTFAADTADGGMVLFEIRFGRLAWSWTVDRR
jgi:hypothetical protein